MFFGRNDAKAETPVLWPPHGKSWLIGKDSDAGRDWGQEEKGMTEDEMAGWHHWLDGHESEWTLGIGDGPGGLACCNSWCRRVGHGWVTELNWTEGRYLDIYAFHLAFSRPENRRDKPEQQVLDPEGWSGWRQSTEMRLAQAAWNTWREGKENWIEERMLSWKKT